jgi:hypothetical protein
MSDEAATMWGVSLMGHGFDLKDWEEKLRAPFDPWVERLQEEYILRSSEFDGLESLEEVQARADALLDQLNGAMAIAGTRRISLGGIIRFNRDGTHHFHMIGASGTVESRSRVSAAGLVIGPDGKPLAADIPQPSEVQRWTKIADVDSHLAEALVHFGRGGWFDLFKVIECIEDLAGGETRLKGLGWIEPSEFMRIKRTANSLRHRRNGKHSPPPKPATHKEASQAVAVLLRKAFDTQPNVAPPAT